jgi:hypothetical protein
VSLSILVRARPKAVVARIRERPRFVPMANIKRSTDPDSKPLFTGAGANASQTLEGIERGVPSHLGVV